MDYNNEVRILCRYCTHISRKTVQAPFGEFETNYCEQFNRTYTDNYIRRGKECIYFEDAKRDILAKEAPNEEKAKTHVCRYCGNETKMKDICSACRDKQPIAREISLMGKAWMKKYGNKR